MIMFLTHALLGGWGWEGQEGKHANLTANVCQVCMQTWKFLSSANSRAYCVVFCHDTKLYFRTTVLSPNLHANTLSLVIVQTTLLSHGYEMGSAGLVPAISAKSKGVENWYNKWGRGQQGGSILCWSCTLFFFLSWKVYHPGNGYVVEILCCWVK